MSEANQNPSSTLKDFDDELNDELIRLYLLKRTYKECLEDKMRLDSHHFCLDSLANEIDYMQKCINDYCEREEDV